MALLDVEGLTVEYDSPAGPVRALEGVSFSLGEGESVGIAGESACGKSTLGLAVARALRGGRVTAGSVRLRGEPLLGMPAAEFDSRVRWKEVSMVFQGAMSSLDPVFTVGGQIGEALAQHGFAGDRERAARDAVGSVGLDAGVLGMYPHELSGGMRQRAVIAMALLLRPALVIADEPTTALDVLVQAQIVDLLKGLRRSGTSLMLITHDMAVLSELCDRVGVMYAGRMVEFGASADVYGSPRHPYTRGLLASVPTLRGPPPGFIPGSPPDPASPGAGCRFAPRCPEAMDACAADPPAFPAGSGFARCWLCEGGGGAGRIAPARRAGLGPD